jgi:hypothetical protein
MTIQETASGNLPQLGIPTSQDYPRLVYMAPYFEMVALADVLAPSVQEAVEQMLPGLVPPYVQDAANEAVAAQAVLLTGSTMTGPLFLSPIMPTQPSQAASMAYVDAMIATAGVPEVPSIPVGQTWARQTGQWVPISSEEGTFLPLTGGTMQGAINMNGNNITGLASVPVLPNGAAPAQWVLGQIAASSLYQGTYTPETNVPDLTQPATHQNAFTWIVQTSNTDGVVIGAPVPGLQGLTVFAGDNLIYSAMAGVFQIVRAGGLSLGEAQSLFVALAGSTMTGPLILSEDPTSAMQAATMQWVEAEVQQAGLGEAPTDGQIYGRNGLAQVWMPVLGLGGGILTGALILAGNATQALGAVPMQQVQTMLGNYLPLSSGGTVTGPIVMSGLPANLTLNSNASGPLQAVPLQQLQSVVAAYLPLTGGTLTGPLTLAGNAAAALQAVPLQQLNSVAAGYLPLTGGTISGSVIVGSVPPPSLPPSPQVGLFAGQMALPSGPFAIFGFNIYRTGAGATDTYYTTGGWGAYTALGGSGQWVLQMFPQGTAGNAATPGATLTYTQTGLLTSTGPIGAINNGVFVTDGTWATGMYSQGASGPLQFGGFSASTGQWSSWFGGFDSSGNFSTAGNIQAGGTSGAGISCATITLGGLSLGNNGGSIFSASEFSSTAGFSTPAGSVTCNNIWIGPCQLWGDSSPTGITVNGEVWAVAFNQSSDPRLKTNQAEYTTGLGAVTQLDPITFQYNGLAQMPDDVANDVTRIGLDAAATQEVMPQMVSSRSAKLQQSDAETTNILGINTDPLVYTLINCIKQI